MTTIDATDVRVGVRLTPEPDRLGEWLADAASFDAAGADAIWMELGGDAELDPLALVAALAVKTYRSRLVVSIEAGRFASGETARGFDTVRRLSPDRVTLLVAADQSDEIAGRVGDVPMLARGADRVEGEGRGGDAERWLSAPAPHDRASWREICAEAAELGATGVVVDAGPVLLDILRNPRPTGDRRDLHIASG